LSLDTILPLVESLGNRPLDTSAYWRKLEDRVVVPEYIEGWSSTITRWSSFSERKVSRPRFGCRSLDTILPLVEKWFLSLSKDSGTGLSILPPIGGNSRTGWWSSDIQGRRNRRGPRVSRHPSGCIERPQNQE
jgi:hypothetical protein